MNLAEQRAEEDRLFSQLCYEVFNNHEGKKILEFLDKKFLLSSVADPSKGINFAYFREGQNNLVRKLKAGLAIHSTNMRGNNDGPNI